MPTLRTSLVIRVREDSCDTWAGGAITTVPFAPMIPAPRVERISPGHLVALATGPSGNEVVVWRWYDPVVIGSDGDESIRLWEPAHGEFVARVRDTNEPHAPGTRVWASAGFPGADWWVADAVGPSEPRVELDEVDAMYTDYGMWPRVFDVDG